MGKNGEKEEEVVVDHHRLSKKVEKRHRDWKPPKVPLHDVFQRRGIFEFKPNYKIIKVEQTVSISGHHVDFRLLQKQGLAIYARKYGYIHFGLVQIGLKPLNRNGLNRNVSVCLRDRRLLNFRDSLLGIVESSLTNGPIYFNCYPNYPVSLSDPNVLDTLRLTVKTHGPQSGKGSEGVVLLYRLYYKLTTTAWSPYAKITDSFKKSTVIQTNLLSSGVPTAKTIDWDSVEVLEDGDFRIKPNTNTTTTTTNTAQVEKI